MEPASGEAKRAGGTAEDVHGAAVQADAEDLLHGTEDRGLGLGRQEVPAQDVDEEVVDLLVGGETPAG